MPDIMEVLILYSILTRKVNAYRSNAYREPEPEQFSNFSH